MKKIYAAAAALVLTAGGLVFWLSQSADDYTSSTAEKKAAHYESNTPSAGAVLPLPPPNVTIDFNFDLAENSKIEILKDGADYGSGDTAIDENKLAMRRLMKQDAPDGAYVVKYSACWPDGSCHDGQFSFSVDRGRAAGFFDMRNQNEVTVRMSQIKFAPMELRVSKGTTVTWVNDDDAEHFVNTDSHPAHTHVLGLNSRSLKKGESYAFTFSEAGSYPYHCSAHASTMTATVIVE